MVTDSVLIRDKWRVTKKFLKVLIIIFSVILILLVAFVLGFLIKTGGGKNVKIVLENPLKNIVFENTNEYGHVDRKSVVDKGIVEFNEEYINYILVALGIHYLHKSPLMENPLIELVLGDETWSSEIINGVPNTKEQAIDGEDLRITISKQEAVESLLDSDVERFMQDSVREGRTNIEMVAGKAELYSKGYLNMYEEMTGEKIKVV